MENYYRHLLNIESSNATTGAILVISQTNHYASIYFKSSNLKNEFDASINCNIEDLSKTNAFNEIISSILLNLGLDWDGDSIPLDVFICKKNNIMNGIYGKMLNIN